VPWYIHGSFHHGMWSEFSRPYPFVEVGGSSSSNVTWIEEIPRFWHRHTHTWLLSEDGVPQNDTNVMVHHHSPHSDWHFRVCPHCWRSTISSILICWEISLSFGGWVNLSIQWSMFLVNSKITWPSLAKARFLLVKSC
jgi:hypothetical protein